MQAVNMPTRPLLRYHGGKWKCGEWIASHFPAHKVYVEPFGGGASVLLQKCRSYAEIYNDLDDDVVNLFRVLQVEDHSRRLVEKLYLTLFSREEFLLAYESTDCPVERARRLIIRSFMGFSGGVNADSPTGFRGKSLRTGCPPAMNWRNYPDCLRFIVERLRGVCVENRDAFDLIPHMDTEDTLFYVDPPYLPDTRVKYGAYRYELTYDDHIKLAALLRDLKGMVVLSGYASDLYDSLYDGWERDEKQVHSDGGSRIECLWLSPATMVGIQQGMRLFADERGC